MSLPSRLRRTVLRLRTSVSFLLEETGVRARQLDRVLSALRLLPARSQTRPLVFVAQPADARFLRILCTLGILPPLEPRSIRDAAVLEQALAGLAASPQAAPLFIASELYTRFHTILAAARTNIDFRTV